MQKFDAFQTFLKAAAVGGIFMVWAKFTKEAFMLSWDIMTNLPIKDTYKASFKAVCEKCQKFYDDDEYHLIHGARLCENCRLKK